MKHLLLFTLTTLIYVSCDSPRDRRTTGATSSNSSSFNGFSSDRTNSGTTTGTTTGTTAGTTTSSLTIPEDAKHCTFSNDGSSGYASSGTHIGAYTICKSSTNENTFYAQIKDPNTNSQGYSSVKICFIPMSNKTSNGSPLHIGNPKCGNFSDSKTIQKIVFDKYAVNANVAVTNVMIFKDLTYYYNGVGQMNTLNAYINCVNYLNLYNNSYYCEVFKTAGFYTLHTL